MFPINWLKQRCTSFVGRSCTARQARYGCHEPRRPSARPRLENLEERCLLSGGITSPTGLISAINLANSSGGPTTITLAAGATFDFEAPNSSSNGLNALPPITGNITIVGNGDTIERTGQAWFRLFDVASGGSLTLANLILQGGVAWGPQGAAADGGAIYASGALSLIGVTVQNCEAVSTTGNAYGGGIYYDGGGSVFLSNCTINTNNAIGMTGGIAGYEGTGVTGGEGAGGGVCVYAASRVTLVNNSFNGNEALGGHAGDARQIGTGGTGGTARGGGLFVLDATPTLISSDNFTANKAVGGNGGTAGTAGAVGYGGDGGLAEGGGLFVDATNLTLNADSINDNTAVGGNGGNGSSPASGGIEGQGEGGVGGGAFGGGVYTTNLSLPALLGTTINQDTVTAGAAGQSGPGAGRPGYPGDASYPGFFGPAMTLSLSSPLPPGMVNTAYDQTITALPLNSGSSPTVSYSLTFSSLGLNFNADGNQLIISGTPATAGPVTFTVTATDSEGSTQPQFYALTINPQHPAFTSAANTTFTVGQGGSFTVTATGSPTPSLSKSGVLPAGVSFTDNGNGTATLGGTPAAGTQGTYHFSITAWNGVGSDFAQNFTLTINTGGGSVTLNVPPLLAFFDSLLGGVKTVNADGTETITDYLFGFPLLVAMFDHSGNLESVDLIGFDVTFLFE